MCITHILGQQELILKINKLVKWIFHIKCYFVHLNQ